MSEFLFAFSLGFCIYLLVLLQRKKPLKPNAILTGSHAYGTPKENSDIDLLIRLDEATEEMLRRHSDIPEQIRFGKLNLIVMRSEEGYRQWEETNKHLIKMAPVTREVAVKAFKETVDPLERQFKYTGGK